MTSKSTSTKAIEDYDLALKQDLVYNQAVEQASENYRIIKINTITVYLTPMIFLKLMWNGFKYQQNTGKG
jgi:hypothetical protein